MLRAFAEVELLRVQGRGGGRGAQLLRVPVMQANGAPREPSLLVASPGRSMQCSSVDWSEFFSQLRRFVAARVRNDADTDDLVQVILERAMTRAGHTEIENVAAWLFGIARNAIADHYRAHARVLAAAADVLEESAAPLGASDQERAQVIGCMQPLLAMLPAAEAQLLRWADMDGRSMQFIADEVGISLSAAKSRVQRARKEFVKVTRECCAISVDARGRVVELTPRSVPAALECAAACQSGAAKTEEDPK